MGGACGTNGEDERFWHGNLKERDHLQNRGIDGRIMFKSKWMGGHVLDSHGSGQ
jgi:hypothetical protein